MNKTLTLSLFACAALSAHAQTITGFGTGQYSNLFADGTFATTATSTTLQIVGPDGGTQVFANVAPIVLSGDFTTATLTLTGTLGLANTNAFKIAIFDALGGDITYKGNWSSFTVANAGSVSLTFDSSAAAFNGTVDSIQLLTGGTGQTVNFTFDNLAYAPAVVVPEPSTYASLAGVAVLGFVAYRRRRVAA